MSSSFKNRVLHAFVWAAIAVVSSSVASLTTDGGAAVDQSIRERAQNEVYIWTDALLALTWAPLVETAVVAVLIIWLLKCRINQIAIILIIAVLAAVVHETAAVGAGRLAFIPFAIFSYVFIERNKSQRDGYVVTALAHFFYNLVAVANLFIEHYSS